jgi:hypothetical protein
MYKAYVTKAKSLFSRDVELFVKVLPHNYPFVLCHFCVLFSDPKSFGPGFESLEWKWLGKVLQRAATLSPEIVLPQVLVLLTEEHRDRNLLRRYTFQLGRAEAIWGRSYKQKLQSIVELGSKANLGPEDFRRLEAITVELD